MKLPTSVDLIDIDENDDFIKEIFKDIQIGEDGLTYLPDISNEAVVPKVDIQDGYM